MNVLLVNLPWYQNGYWGVRAGSRWPHIKNETERDYLPFPFYLAYATALLQKNTFNTRLVDCIASEHTFLELQKITHQFKPEVIVAEISAPSRDNDLSMLRELYDLHHVKIIVTGPDIESIASPSFLETHPFIHAAIEGEYEHTLLEYLTRTRQNVSCLDMGGIIFRSHHGIAKGRGERLLGDVDSLPWPHRESLPMKKYIDAPGGLPLPSAQMWGSRGCPYVCTFCAWPQIMSKPKSYRFRNTTDILNEMEYLVHDLKFKSVYFDDDTFNVGVERMHYFCDALIKRQHKGRLKVPWGMMGRADLMNEDLLKKLRVSGLFSVKYGVESADQHILDLCNKKMKIDRSVHMILLTQSLGIKTHLTFTFGLPGETKETIQKTIDLALKTNPTSLQFSIATPFPGTRLHKELQEKGQLVPFEAKDLDGHHTAVITTSSLTPHDLVMAKQSAYTLWKQHLMKQRSPEPISLGLWHIKRTKALLKEQGFQATLSKIKDYLSFYSQYNRDIHLGKRHMLNGGPLRIAKVQENICFFYHNTELTRGPGLHSSFIHNDKRYDTTLCHTEISKPADNTLCLKMDLSGQGLKGAYQFWRLHMEDTQVHLLVQFLTVRPVVLSNFKVTLSVIDAFDEFNNDGTFIRLSPIEDWHTHMIKSQGNEVFLKASQNGHPVITCDIFANHFPFKEEIQNSSRMISSRMLHAHCDEIHVDAGRHNLFQGKFQFTETQSIVGS